MKTHQVAKLYSYTEYASALTSMEEANNSLKITHVRSVKAAIIIVCEKSHGFSDMMIATMNRSSAYRIAQRLRRMAPH